MTTERDVTMRNIRHGNKGGAIGASLPRQGDMLMALEIERKFLVVDQTWRSLTSSSQHIMDHLIASFENGKARIRICGGSTILTLKGQRRGIARSEYHVPVSEVDARDMISEFALFGSRCHQMSRES
jgi:hypothetical protein